jgi:hypothetical protein
MPVTSIIAPHALQPRRSVYNNSNTAYQHYPTTTHKPRARLKQLEQTVAANLLHISKKTHDDTDRKALTARNHRIRTVVIEQEETGVYWGIKK